MTAPIEIKPCPFCDSENILIYESEAKSNFFGECMICYCRCKCCGCQGPWSHNVGKDDEENSNIAIKNWNTRNILYDRTD